MAQSGAMKALVFGLLTDWCDGLIQHQIIDPSDPSLHGMLECPACEVVHARLIDAVYPLLAMANATGDRRYLDAGIAAFEWGENVSRPNGSWTNDLEPDSWDGTTVFAAISLAEALHFHGDLLEAERRERWMVRLKKAAEFVYHRFTGHNANINYGATTIYALALAGRLLDHAPYIQRSKELAVVIREYFSQPNGLLFGEKRFNRKELSAKGLPGIDLGYNVEESFNGLVMYALLEQDEDLLDLLVKSMNSHLEFMLPDGAWDNSWGTRQFKWSYWGSRTSDGCQPAFAMMAHMNPAFGTAVVKNTELLKACTADGLLHGGPHYITHGVKPCIHHTFCHAKNLAVLLDRWDDLPVLHDSTPLPRVQANGILTVEELDTTLFARGDWRGTVTAYDGIYFHGEDHRQATGGALSLLYHQKAGLLFSASMAKYKLAEINNQQPAPGEDIALTPRIETFSENDWYTNLFDLTASISSSDQEGEIEIVANSLLKNEAKEIVENTASGFRIDYRCAESRMEVSASTSQKITMPTVLVLPIISPSGETVTQVLPNEITIQKPDVLVRLVANVPLTLKKMPRSRTFNMVPGLEAVPVLAFFPEDSQQVQVALTVES